MIDKTAHLPTARSGKSSFKDISDIAVYPNPASDRFYLSNVSQVGSKISLFEIGGKMKLENVNFTTDGINISALSAGSYMIRIDTNDGQQIVRKLLIAR